MDGLLNQRFSLFTVEHSTLANVIGIPFAFAESAEPFSLTLATPSRNFMREAFGWRVKFGMTFAGPVLPNPTLLGGL